MMNTFFVKLICSLFVLSAWACERQPVDSFVLRGIVPGAMDSSFVQLTPTGKFSQKLAVGYIVDEKFELRGNVPYPMLCDLDIDNWEICERKGISEEEKDLRKINFFVENGKLKFRTPHLDSLPKPYWGYDPQKDKNYVLKGSSSQDDYYQYQQQSLPLRSAIGRLREKHNETKDINDFKLLSEKQSLLNEQILQFMQTHKNLYVNLYLAEWVKKGAFAYDQNYLDKLESLFASYQDTCSLLQDFRQYLKDAARFVQGKSLKDSKVIALDKKELQLLAQLNKGGYSVIDFWASWCMPCRASFPHLRKMYEQYGEKVTFISVSIDQNESDWQKAMDEEQLPWMQFLASKDLRDNLASWYNMMGIPTFLLINPEGKIVFSGHSSEELELQLEEL